MRKFRKKPVIIEAEQITAEMFEVEHPSFVHIKGVIYKPIDKQVEIHTLEGIMTGNVGDWIIRGVQGELYPCKADIFAETYDEVEE